MAILLSGHFSSLQVLHLTFHSWVLLTRVHKALFVSLLKSYTIGYVTWRGVHCSLNETPPDAVTVADPRVHSAAPAHAQSPTPTPPPSLWSRLGNLAGRCSRFAAAAAPAGRENDGDDDGKSSAAGGEDEKSGSHCRL